MEPSLVDVARAVHQLSEAVTDWRANAVDRETVERIARDVLAESRGADWSGYQPRDSGETYAGSRSRQLPEGRDRVGEVLTRPADEVAALISRPVERVNEFREATDHLLLLSTVMRCDPTETHFFNSAYLPALASLDTQTATAGADYVPRDLSATLIERVALELVVPSLFPVVVMESNPLDVPGLGVSRMRTGIHAEQTTDSGQTGIKKISPLTRKVTLTAQRFAAETVVSRDLDEDSLIPIIPWLQAELVDFLAADVEDAILNGDESETHQDGDVTDADDPRKHWTGLRKATDASAKSDASNVALTVAHLRKSRQKMGRYGARADQLAHIVGVAGYVQLLSDASVITLEKYGPSASVLTGELAKVDGAPVVVSEYVRQDLNTSGVRSGSTTDRTVAITVNRRGFLLGDRRTVNVQILRELYSEADMNAIVVTMRKAFASRFPLESERTVGLAHNLSTS